MAKDRLSIKARCVSTLSLFATEGEYSNGPLHGVYRTLIDAAVRYDSPAVYMKYRAIGALDGAAALLENSIVEDDDSESAAEAVKAHTLCVLALNILDSKSAAERDRAIVDAQDYCLETFGTRVDLRKGLEGFAKEATNR